MIQRTRYFKSMEQLVLVCIPCTLRITSVDPVQWYQTWNEFWLKRAKMRCIVHRPFGFTMPFSWNFEFCLNLHTTSRSVLGVECYLSLYCDIIHYLVVDRRLLILYSRALSDSKRTARQRKYCCIIGYAWVVGKRVWTKSDNSKRLQRLSHCRLFVLMVNEKRSIFIPKRLPSFYKSNKGIGKADHWRAQNGVSGREEVDSVLSEKKYLERL